jgi:hypothetical protein
LFLLLFVVVAFWWLRLKDNFPQEAAATPLLLVVDDVAVVAVHYWREKKRRVSQRLFSSGKRHTFLGRTRHKERERTSAGRRRLDDTLLFSVTRRLVVKFWTPP